MEKNQKWRNVTQGSRNALIKHDLFLFFYQQEEYHSVSSWHRFQQLFCLLQLNNMTLGLEIDDDMNGDI